MTLKTRGLVFAALVPTLVLVTVMAARTVHSGIEQAILVGFEKKLFASSTVMGSFIDGEDHDRIMRERVVTGLAFAGDNGTLYGGTTDGLLVALSREDGWSTFGAARSVGPTGLASLGDLAWDAGTGQLYAVGPGGDHLVRLDRQTGAAARVGPLGRPALGLAPAPEGGWLWAGGQELVRVEAATGRGTRVASLGPGGVRGLAAGPAPHLLYGVDGATGGLLLIDVRTGARTPTDTAAAATVLPDAARALAAGLALDPRTRSLYGVRGNRLVVLEPATGQVVKQGYAGFRDEQDPLYQYYYGRMRRAKEKCDLTFLYTYILVDPDSAVAPGHQRPARNRGTQIVYGLDAEALTDEALHSQTGSVDSDVAGEEIRDVLLKGVVHLSGIVFWQEWGLLKSATAPVYGRDGVVRAVAGADVNVNKIQQKTRSALVKVCLVGLASLLLAGVVCIYMAGRVSHPIRQLKEGALRVAAGDYGHQIPMHGLQEIGELTAAFNRISTALRDRMEHVARDNRALEDGRSRRQLLRLLQRDAAQATLEVAPGVACARLGDPAGKPDSSGWVAANGAVLLWAAGGDADAARAARLHRDLALIAQRLLARHAADPRALAAALGCLLGESVKSWALLDAASRCAWGVAGRPMIALAIESTGRASRRELTQDGCVRVPPGQALCLSTSDLAASSDDMGVPQIPATGGPLQAVQVLRALQQGHAAPGGVLAVLTGASETPAPPAVKDEVGAHG
jgi:HAMP domain-containing protein